MEFTHQFRVEAPVERVFDTLIDLERVAPCMPGATLDEVEDDTYTGRMKVKVGPIQVTYRGQARLTEVDREALRATILAEGKETRGAGTANARVTAALADDGAATSVTVHTDLTITGKPAQFGRGVMADVGERIIQTFADRLADLLAAEPEPAPAAATAAPTDAVPETTGEVPAAVAGAPPTVAPDELATADESAAAETTPPTGRRRIAPVPGREEDVLDLVEVAGAATLRRVAPVVAALAAAAGLRWWWRRR